MADKIGFFQKLKKGLSKTRNNVVKNLENLFMGVTSIDEDFYEELEETLICGDLGVNTTENIIDELREIVEADHLSNPEDCKDVILRLLKEAMASNDDRYAFENRKTVIFVTGVNGVGKTTSIGKLANHYREEGKKVLLAACDTFRAAAREQLETWSKRSGVEMISGADGSDPSSVLFDAINAAKKRNTDILICDTAGRLHNKKNLMEELKKMYRVIEKEGAEFGHENLLVLDATTGQNAIEQAKEFRAVSDLTGIILTKMDGTAKGGMAVSIQNELGIPVKFIGVGEGIDDMYRFDADQFVDALFSKDEE